MPLTSIMFEIGLAAFIVVGGWMATRAIAAFSSRRFPLWAAIAICGLIAVWSSIVLPQTFMLAVTLCLGWLLFVAAAIDAFEFRLPDLFTITLIVAGLAIAAIVSREELMAHLIGAAVGYVAFASFAWAYRKLRGRDGLGLGDAKLVAGAGVLLGWQALPSIVLMASLAGLLWYGVMALRRGRHALAERMPFGVPLCLVIWIVWLYGPPTGFMGP